MKYCQSCKHWNPTDTLITHGTCDRLGNQVMSEKDIVSVGDFRKKDMDFEGEDRLLSQVGFRLTEDNLNDPIYASIMVRTPFSVTNDSVGPFDVVDVGAFVGVSF